jgi:excisionase family DNA binding protein
MPETQATAETLLTVREAAREARVSPVHLYRLINAGVVPAIRVGEGRGPLRVPADEFRSWLFSEPRSAA